MKVIRSDEADRSGRAVPDPGAMLAMNWLQGPGETMDVGIVSMTAGSRIPRHIHLGGQVIVVTGGRGFVETADGRVEVGPGDIVIAPKGEAHVHGAADDSDFSHITVTTGGYEFPDGPPPG
jgi:quercetin dioxygenase-like cupin family protein